MIYSAHEKSTALLIDGVSFKIWEGSNSFYTVREFVKIILVKTVVSRDTTVLHHDINNNHRQNWQLFIC